MRNQTSFKFLKLFSDNPYSLKYKAALNIPLSINVVNRVKRWNIKPSPAKVMAIKVKNTVIAPISAFKNRKIGEYTLTINPFNNPASPIRKVGMPKKYITKPTVILGCVNSKLST
ncbi:MAG: hypothetical protein ACTSQW_10055 [Promethearchaeota archaeon]